MPTLATEPSVTSIAPTGTSSSDVPLSGIVGVAEWDDLRRQLTILLRQPPANVDWVKQARALSSRQRALAGRDVDMGLYLLMQQGGGEVENYSSHHSLLCAVVCEICAAWLEWSEDEIESLVGAALTMNASIATLQDVLAKQMAPMTEAQRKAVDEHPTTGANQLQAAGLDDALWVEVVRRHGRDVASKEVKTPADRLAQLLRRVDVYTAKLSRRVSRHAASPAIAARDACLDATGLPDAIGATMLRSMGLYPPGSFVVLANEEVAVVVKRGSKAHTPIVASLRRADGGLLPQPTRRDTSDPKLAVKRGIPANDVKIRLNHLRVLGV